jgi:glyoxylase-like metal-dependent hydrolase (beta-lactamase superfamily II)
MFIQRNGIPVSPYAVMHEYFIRHGDRLLLISQIDDPVYLEEPMVRTSTFRLNPGARENPIAQVDVAEEIPGLRQGDVPHYPLGATHPEYAEDNKLPFAATLGGKATLYPEYVDTLKQMARQPAATPATVVTGAGTAPSPPLPPAPKGRAASDLARPYRPTYEDKGEVEVLPVQGTVYMVAGAGSNVTVQVGPAALFVVDTNQAAMSDKILAAIKTISPLPVRYVVNTSGDADHVGGNERFARSADAASVNAFYEQGARVYSSEAAYARMTNPKRGAPMASALWPTDSFAAPLKTLFVTGEPIELIHQPAHTDGDLMVFFRKSDVIAAGDIFCTDRYPVVDASSGGTLAGVLDGLNRLIDLAIPEFNSMGGTRVIPGHGRIANEIDLVEYRDAVTIIADRITQLVLEGKTLEQVKAAGVSLDYDGVYGATTGEWTTDMFVEAVYREIKGNTPPWKARLLRNVPAAELSVLAGGPKAPATKAATTARAARKPGNDPLEGTWTLDLFASSYEPSSLMPYRREMTITVDSGKTTHAVSSWRRPQGNGSPLSTYSYTARFDGKPYPIPNWGKASVMLKRVDGNTIERTLDGEDVGKETATWTLSADRKTLTVVARGTDASGVAYTSTQVYEKQ